MGNILSMLPLVALAEQSSLNGGGDIIILVLYPAALPSRTAAIAALVERFQSSLGCYLGVQVCLG